MRWIWLAGGVLVVVTGVVWLLQGLGSEFVPQSFMTDSGVWVAIGGATASAGVAIILWTWSRR